jgi:6-phosphofructokinase 1
MVEGSIVKRLGHRRPYGVAVVAEGIGERLEPGDLAALASAPRDEHGHIRLAEVPLGRVIRDAVQVGLTELGIKITIGEKDVGYELRCAAPNAFDLDYTRDLGAGAVRALLEGRSGVMITRQESAIVPIPFDEMMDLDTGRTRIRLVDTSTQSHQTVWTLQVRIEKADLEGESLATIASATNLDGEGIRQRYASICA